MFKLAWEWRDEALDIHWFLTSEERELLYKKTTHGRLGFAVLLKYFQNEGRFPEHFDEVPRIVLAYLANQIDVPRCDLSDYSLNGRTAKRDRAEILQQLGIRRTTQQDLQDVKKSHQRRATAEQSLRRGTTGFFSHMVQTASNCTTHTQTNTTPD